MPGNRRVAAAAAAAAAPCASPACLPVVRTRPALRFPMLLPSRPGGSSWASLPRASALSAPRLLQWEGGKRAAVRVGCGAGWGAGGDASPGRDLFAGAGRPDAGGRRAEGKGRDTGRAGPRCGKVSGESVTWRWKGSNMFGGEESSN